MQEAQLYLMRDNRSGYHKIGISKDPKYRESTLQAEQPDVVLIDSAPASRSCEEYLHANFANCRIRGEWFDLGEPELWEMKTVFCVLDMVAAFGGQLEWKL